MIADGSPRPHRRQRVVQEQRIGDMGAVVAGEPDLVDAVVEADDSVFRSRLNKLFGKMYPKSQAR
jgi:hypothetical protein